jgi:hypothetical protein
MSDEGARAGPAEVRLSPVPSRGGAAASTGRGRRFILVVMAVLIIGALLAVAQLRMPGGLRAQVVKLKAQAVKLKRAFRIASARARRSSTVSGRSWDRVRRALPR